MTFEQKYSNWFLLQESWRVQFVKSISKLVKHISFEDFQLRLVGGKSSHEGRLEMFYQGSWGAICSNQTWDIFAADVACRHIGVGPAVAKVAGFTASPIEYIACGVNCIGNEEKLSDCQFDGLGEKTCDDTGVASLRCSPFVVPVPEKGILCDYTEIVPFRGIK